jgi:hypothetical protein
MKSTLKTTTLLSLLALTMLSACASIPRHEDGDFTGQQKAIDRYTPYLGERVSQFNMYTRFDSWTPVDNDHVVVHTNVNEAYLLTLAPGCFDLPFANSIGVTSKFPHTVQSGFDSIRVGRQSCRISDIQPLNYKQMRADLKAEKERARG